MDYSTKIKKMEELQKKIIEHIISKKDLLKLFNPPSQELKEEDINYMLVNNEDYNLVFQTHKLIISCIIFNIISKQNKQSKKFMKKYFYCFGDSPIENIFIDIPIKDVIEDLSSNEIMELLDKFHTHYLTSRFIYKDGNLEVEKSSINFKDKGSVYTPSKIAAEISRKTIDNKLKQGMPVNKIKILDFGCGTGRFYFSIFDYLTKKFKLDKREVIKNNVYAIDIDSIALDILKIKLFTLINNAKFDDLEIISKNIIDKNMLIEDKKFLKSICYEKDFKDVMIGGGFDVIVSNPPYFLLKVNKKTFDDINLKKHYDRLKDKIDDEVRFFRQNKGYTYSIEGMLNYYKLSIEMIIRIAKENAEIGIICPSTLFADISSKKLRKYLILDNKLREVRYFPESAKLFYDISQSTAIFYLQKGEKTDKIKINIDDKSFYITLDLIQKAFKKTYEIPFINKTGWRILEKTSNFSKLREIKNIRNKRGELDLSMYKNYITKQYTGWRLIRGNMISKEAISDKNGEFVLINGFIERKSKDYIENDYRKERLICQQISNKELKKRLNFVKCGHSDIIANSCNYLTVIGLDIDKLRKILNSLLLNWRFNITSSNNHINNYELDELPIIDMKRIKDLDGDELKNNVKICKAYGLDDRETLYVLKTFFKQEEIKRVAENENIQPYQPQT